MKKQHHVVLVLIIPLFCLALFFVHSHDSVYAGTKAVSLSGGTSSIEAAQGDTIKFTASGYIKYSISGITSGTRESLNSFSVNTGSWSSGSYAISYSVYYCNTSRNASGDLVYSLGSLKYSGTCNVNLRGSENGSGSGSGGSSGTTTDRISRVELDQTVFFYDGTAKEPKVKVYNARGKLLTKDRDYYCSYRNNIEIGTAQVFVSGRGNYSGYIHAVFQIYDENGIPKGILDENGKLTLYWDKNTHEGEGTVIPFPQDGQVTLLNLPWDEYSSEIKEVVIDQSFSGFKSSTTSRWFYNLSKCGSIQGIENIDTSGVSDFSYMFANCFANCGRWADLNLRTMDTSQATNMSYMFYGCALLDNLNLRGLDTSNVTDMSYMFSGCSNITIFDFRSFNTENVTTMEGMFSNCTSVRALDLSSFNTSSVTTMAKMFSGCTSLLGLEIDSFDTNRVKTMEEMFKNCKVLPRVNLSSFLTGNVRNMDNMFYGDEALTTIAVTYWGTGMLGTRPSIFGRCTSLTGEQGTKYSSANDDKTYSRIDGGTSKPGYLTRYNPNMVKTPGVKPTCTQGGTQTYWTDTSTGKYYSDAFATRPMSEGAWNLSATGHTYYSWEITAPATCEASGSKVRRCRYCDAFEEMSIDPAGHDWEDDYTIDDPGTCLLDGSKSKHCKNCPEITDETVVKAPGGHDLTKHEANEASCLEEGNIAYWSCSRCGGFFSDKNGDNSLEENGWTIAKTDHDYGELVEEKPVGCLESGMKEHYQCSVCHAYFDGDKQPTMREELIIEAKGHPELVTHEANDATYTHDGNKAYWSCDTCGGYFCDSQGTQPIEQNSWIIKALPQKTQPVRITSATKTVKLNKVKKKAVTVAPIKVKGAKGTISYKVTGGNAKSKKALKVNAKTGKVKVVKKTKKGTYKVKVTVKVTASANNEFIPFSKTVKVTVKVK